MGILRHSPGQKAAVKNIVLKHIDQDSNVAGRSSPSHISGHLVREPWQHPTAWDDGDESHIPNTDSTCLVPFAQGWREVAVREAVPSRPISRAVSLKRGLSLFDDKIRYVVGMQNSEDEHPLQRRFNMLMGGVITMNSIILAIETDYAPRETSAPLSDRIAWILIEMFFIILYGVEIGLRIYWERQMWPHSWWNWLDVALVICSIVDTAMALASVDFGGLGLLIVLRIVRLARLIRMVKLVRAFNGFYVVMMAAWHALGSMARIGCAMVFGIFLCAIFTTSIIGRSEDLADVRPGGDTVENRFGTVPRSMYSLFELMTLEGLEEVVRPLIMAQPALLIFFISFIMLFSFGLLNMVVGLVVEQTLDQAQQHKQIQSRERNKQIAGDLLRMKNIFEIADRNNDGVLSCQEFEEVLRNSDTAKEALDSLGIPERDAHELFSIIDWDGIGCISVEEFLEGIARALGATPQSWDSIATRAGVRSLARNMWQLRDEVATLKEQQNAWQNRFEAEVTQRLDAQEQLLRRLETALAPEHLRTREIYNDGAHAAVRNLH